MFLKKRMIATAAVIAMAAAAVYGSTQEMSQTQDTGERLQLFRGKETIYCWYSDEALSGYINAAAVSFGEQNKVRVIPVLTSDSEYLEAVNQETLHSDQIPDIYLLSSDSLEKAYLAGLATKVPDTEGICDTDHFSQAALAAVTYDDKIIGYPVYFDTSALVYNEDYLRTWATQQAEKELSGSSDNDEPVGEGEEIIEEDSLPEDQTTDQVTADEAAVNALAEQYFAKALPSTVDDLLNIADTFDAPEGVEGVMKWDVNNIFYNYWIVGNYMIVGGDPGDDRNDININNPETIQCLEVYKALNQFFFIESDTVTYDSVIQDFIDGKTMFTIGTTDVVKRMEDAKADGSLTFNYGFARMPDGDLTGKEAANMLQKVCDEAKAHLWFDLEVFLFNPDNSLYPRPVEEIIRDLNLFDNFEKILCYQFPGVFNDPKMSIRVGEARTIDLFNGYMKYLKELKAKNKKRK